MASKSPFSGWFKRRPKRHPLLALEKKTPILKELASLHAQLCKASNPDTALSAYISNNALAKYRDEIPKLLSDETSQQLALQALAEQHYLLYFLLQLNSINPFELEQSETNRVLGPLNLDSHEATVAHARILMDLKRTVPDVALWDLTNPNNQIKLFHAIMKTLVLQELEPNNTKNVVCALGSVASVFNEQRQAFTRPLEHADQRVIAWCSGGLRTNIIKKPNKLYIYCVRDKKPNPTREAFINFLHHSLDNVIPMSLIGHQAVTIQLHPLHIQKILESHVPILINDLFPLNLQVDSKLETPKSMYLRFSDEDIKQHCDSKQIAYVEIQASGNIPKHWCITFDPMNTATIAPLIDIFYLKENHLQEKAQEKYARQQREQQEQPRREQAQAQHREREKLWGKQEASPLPAVSPHLSGNNSFRRGGTRASSSSNRFGRAEKPSAQKFKRLLTVLNINYTETLKNEVFSLTFENNSCYLETLLKEFEDQITKVNTRVELIAQVGTQLFAKQFHFFNNLLQQLAKQPAEMKKPQDPQRPKHNITKEQQRNHDSFVLAYKQLQFINCLHQLEIPHHDDENAPVKGPGYHSALVLSLNPKRTYFAPLAKRLNGKKQKVGEAYQLRITLGPNNIDQMLILFQRKVKAYQNQKMPLADVKYHSAGGYVRRQISTNFEGKPSKYSIEIFFTGLVLVKQAIDSRHPHYYAGQLLLDKDSQCLVPEDSYHLDCSQGMLTLVFGQAEKAYCDKVYSDILRKSGFSAINSLRELEGKADINPKSVGTQKPSASSKSGEKSQDKATSEQQPFAAQQTSLQALCQPIDDKNLTPEELKVLSEHGLIEAAKTKVSVQSAAAEAPMRPAASIVPSKNQTNQTVVVRSRMLAWKPAPSAQHAPATAHQSDVVESPKPSGP